MPGAEEIRMTIAMLPTRPRPTPMTTEASDEAGAGRRVRLGMVGGAQAAFMGAVHRIAARLDDHYEVVAAAPSAMPDETLRATVASGPARAYADYRTMAREEAARPDGAEAVSIVAPSHQHAQIAEAFLQAGIHVLCDKPTAVTLAEVQRLKTLAQRTGRLFAVTRNYAGYAMVRRARRLVREGALGDVRVAQVDYPQEGSSECGLAMETAGATSEAAGCIGELCGHAFDLLHYVTGLATTDVCAPCSAPLGGDGYDARGQIMLRLANGAHGLLWASQRVPENDSGLRLRVYGSRGTLEWSQERPDQLGHTVFGQALRSAAHAGLADSARVARLPSGAEGFLEAFATLYAEIAQAIRTARGGAPLPGDVEFPTLDDAIHGLAFDDAARRSSADGGCWVRL
jgi:predicted dehydrogenase